MNEEKSLSCFHDCPLGDCIYTVDAQFSPWYLHGAAHGNHIWLV